MKALPTNLKSHTTLLQQFGHQSGPPRLVARSYTGAIIAVEILIKQNMVAPVGIVLERRLVAVYGPSPILILQKNAA